jgi:hypothetical protein
LPQARDAHRRRPEVYARDAGAEAARRTYDARTLPLPRKTRRARRLLFFE